ncbi:MAG TPA: endonuclease III [Candidatus Saccharimonadales bacterium]|nr:endonuclease III [Candidatus Saccharimonadales bacterium]
MPRPVAAASKPRPAPIPAWTPERVAELLARLKHLHPDAKCSLDHVHPLQLLVATILSAQCTDERVNIVTPGLFRKYPTAADLAAAPRAELEAEIRSTGFFRAKARSIQECCRDLVAKHGGQVPRTMEELTALRGVGRKTANVVLGNAYGIPGVVVDTHVGRLARRLGLTQNEDPVKVELDLMEVIPREEWTLFSHLLIHHGRRVCPARKPHCSRCALADLCPRVEVEDSD